jgi:hypothetical protein
MTIRETLDRLGEPAWWKDEPFRDWAARAIKCDGVARHSCGKLLAAGINERELLEFLVGRAVWAFHARGSRPWYFRSKMTREQVEYLPGRLRKMACEIEKLNECLAGSGLFSGQIPVPARGFGQMPELLRRYADFVALASRRKTRFGRMQALDELLQFVREETGKPRFGDITNLLTAVAHDAGVQRDFGSDALKVRDSRRRKRSSAK